MNAVPRITVDSTGMTVGFSRPSAADADAMLALAAARLEACAVRLDRATRRNCEAESLNRYDVSPVLDAIHTLDALLGGIE